MDGRGGGGFFSLGRGVRQDYPLSLALPIYCVKVLAIAIRGDKDIKGISMRNLKGKLGQYADDTTMILDGSQTLLERSFALRDSFGQLSGLRVNCEKTEALWIGSKKGSNQIICPEKNLKWADGKVKFLWDGKRQNKTV